MKSTSRRGFLGILGAAAASSFALDPEKLLWVPGVKTISIPAIRKSIRFPVRVVTGAEGYGNFVELSVTGKIGGGDEIVINQAFWNYYSQWGLDVETGKHRPVVPYEGQDAHIQARAQTLAVSAIEKGFAPVVPEVSSLTDPLLFTGKQSRILWVEA